jgi:Glycosyltransferase
MRIAIEAQRIFRPKKHGMDFVALEMIRELQKIDKENEYRIYVRPDDDKCLEETPNFKIVVLPSWGDYPVWEQWALAREVNRWNPDLLHCTSNTAPLFVSCKLVITLHDIIFLEKKHDSGKVSKTMYQTLGYLYRKTIVPSALKKAVKIITVSKYEEQRISEALCLPAGKLTAVYNGYSEHFYPREINEEVKQKYGLPKRYFFFLGNTDPKKNTQRVLKAYYSYLSQSMNPVPLVVADLKEEVIKAFPEWKEERFRNNIILAGYIPNADLPFIYSMAELFLYPSLRESFGIPILEAMACGLPVITSNTSAMPEIAGDGAIFVDPYQVSGIAAKLLELERTPLIVQRQREYGLLRVKKFSWRNTASDVLEIYKAISHV